MLIRDFFFDLGDTLVEMRPEVYEDSAHRIAAISGRIITADDLRKVIKDEWCFRNGENIQWVNTEKRETQYWRGFYRNVLKRLGDNTPSQSLVNLLAFRAADPDSFICFYDVIGVLEELHRRGRGIGLISNAFPSARQIMDNLNLTRWFNPLILSYEFTCAKPCPDIYQYALRCANGDSRQALFVDDRPKFIDGATQDVVRMQVRLLNREGKCQSTHPKISSLYELLELL